MISPTIKSLVKKHWGFLVDVRQARRRKYIVPVELKPMHRKLLDAGVLVIHSVPFFNLEVFQISPECTSLIDDLILFGEI